MRFGEKVLSVVLCIIMVFAIVPTTETFALSSSAVNTTTTEYKTGDIVEFGTYPQSDVTKTLGTILDAIGGEWNSYNYYAGQGWSSRDGGMVVSDFMKYKDVVYEGNKYRGVVFDAYRPAYTYEGLTTQSGSSQYYNHYYAGKTYWFRYEPIEWRVLDPESGLIMCNSLIDSQPFNNYVAVGEYKKIGSSFEEVFWGDPEHTYYASNYAKSSIRRWLTEDFYNTAFSYLQKTNIKTTELNNDCYSTLMGRDGYSELNAPSTADKVFLLSHADLCNAKYGFEYTGNWMDESHALIGTDYAYCQGLTVRGGNTNRVGDRICWWTRTPSGTRGAINIHGWNYREGISYAYRTDNGVCPAISLYELKSDVEIDYELISELDWSISDDGILTIAGNGAMPNYQDIQKVPWYKVREQIKSVVIEEGITKIGKMSFAHCINMAQISIPLSVKTIESMAFKNCNALKDIYYAGTYRDWNCVDVVNNKSFLEADIHYQGTIPTEEKDPIKNPVKHIYEANGYESRHNVVFNNAWLTQDHTVYNHDLARFCSDFAMLAYSEKDKVPQEDLFKANLSEFGFQDIKTGFSTGKNESGRNDVNYFIAYKDVNYGGKISTILFAGFIGSNGYQWFSNFDPLGYENKNHDKSLAEGTAHRGFADARDFALDIIKKYVEDHKINIRCTKLLLTGHSRGAAAANILAAKAIDDGLFAYPQNIYAYTFATPNSVLANQVQVDADRYKCIFNIVNPEDFVTKVLLRDWGFARYGITYTLPSKTNDVILYNRYLREMKTYFTGYTCHTYTPYPGGEAEVYDLVETMGNRISGLGEYYKKDDFYGGGSMFEYFKKAICPFVAHINDWRTIEAIAGSWLSFGTLKKIVTEFFIKNQKSDPYFEKAHQIETYCAYMHSLSKNELTNFGHGRKGYKGTVNCPVDIEIYNNQTNELVGRIVNNVVDETVAAKENSIVMSVNGESKSYWLPSNGDYRVVLTGNDNGTMDYSVSEIDSDVGETERVNFFDVEIKQGVSMTETFSEELTDINDCALILPNGQTITPTENVTGEAKTYQINVTVDGSGYASESKTATSGDYVSFDAAEADDSAFVGWYEDGKLIERDTSLSFVAKKNRNLVAKFQDVMSAAQINIKPTTTVDYRSRVTVVASASYVPNGYYVALYDGSKQLAKGDNKTVRYKVGEMRANKTLTVKLIDASDNVQKDSKGKDLSENIEIKVNAGFFKKLAAFFKGMFGLLPNVEIKPGIEAKEAVYTLSYDANGGSGAPAKQNGFGKVTISNTQPTRNGYSFLGWGLTATTSNVLYKSGATITLATNTILYAVWKQDDYILTYHANGGENAPEKQAGNGTITLSTKTPTRDGYVFTGWATSSIASSSQYSAGSSYILSKNTTLYAVWVIKGDINMDGEINLVDLTRLRYFLAGTVELTKIQLYIADLNNDGTIDDADLTLMRQLLVGITS